MVRKKPLMPRREGALVFALKICGAVCRIRTGEFIVQQNGIGIVHDAQVMFPEPRTVIRFFVISGLESLIKAAKRVPGLSWRQQEGARAVVDVATEHIHSCERIVATPMTEARTIA